MDAARLTGLAPLPALPPLPTPLALTTGGSNSKDSTQTMVDLESAPPQRRKPGRPARTKTCQLCGLHLAATGHKGYFLVSVHAAISGARGRAPVAGSRPGDVHWPPAAAVLKLCMPLHVLAPMTHAGIPGQSVRWDNLTFYYTV